MKSKGGIFLLIVVAGVVGIGSCDTNNLNDIVFREDPYPDKITIERINDGNTIKLSWGSDRGADTYRIMKTTYDEENLGVFQSIYTGEETHYIDRDINTAANYAYRLDKLRGTKAFEGESIVRYGKTKTRPDLFSGMVRAQNLNNGKSAYLTWDADSGADGYRIMRAVNDGNALVFHERMDGQDGYSLEGVTSAIDGSLEDDKGYFYRLDKQRDMVWQTGIDITLFSRTRPLPYSGTLTAKSFRPDGYIELIWNYDDGADSYEVQRHNDTTKVDTLVYSGTGITFVDQTVNSDQNHLYVYTLLKIRNGQSYFGGKAAAVAVKTQIDAHEPNDTEGDATLLEDYRQGNLYYYLLTTGEEILDVDWYKVSVPAGKTVNIVITYTNSSNTDFFLQYNPYQEQPVIAHNTAFHVRNDGNVQKMMYFAIIPNKPKFLNMMPSGGQLVSYTITWLSISNNP